MLQLYKPNASLVSSHILCALGLFDFYFVLAWCSAVWVIWFWFPGASPSLVEFLFFLLLFRCGCSRTRVELLVSSPWLSIGNSLISCLGVLFSALLSVFLKLSLFLSLSWWLCCAFCILQCSFFCESIIGFVFFCRLFFWTFAPFMCCFCALHLDFIFQSLFFYRLCFLNVFSFYVLLLYFAFGF